MPRATPPKNAVPKNAAPRRKKAAAPPTTINQVHVTTEGVANREMTPPHPPRVATPEYAKAHDFLINQQNRPCLVCGVRKSTLDDTALNPFGATQLESHHYPIERSLADACDPVKVHQQFPQVYDATSLMTFVDSPANLLVLCNICHRSPDLGIHHLLVADWAIRPFLRTGYQVTATDADAATVEARDAALMPVSA